MLFIIYLIFGIFLLVSFINFITSIFSLKEEESYELFFPTVSVIIRTWNDGSVVERCILNLLDQNYPKEDYEIIIVDDGSTDNTKEICESYAKEGKIKYVRLPKHFEYKADVIDYAIKNFAIGDIILETDVDFVLPKNWIKEMVKPFSDEEVKAVTGMVMCGNWYRNWLSHLRAIEDFWYFCISMYGRYKLTKQGTLYGSSKAYRKSVWEEIGGHPKEILNEDTALFAKIIERGYKIVNIKIPNLGEEVEEISQYFAERKRWAGSNFEAFLKYNKIFRKDILFYLVLCSNFSIDAIFLFSFILLFFNKIFLIPILINLFGIWIGLWGLNAKNEFYIWSFLYLTLSPILQFISLFLAFKDKMKGGIRWEKIWHHPTPLLWPIKGTEKNKNK